jgi:hypothetical protein
MSPKKIFICPNKISMSSNIEFSKHSSWHDNKSHKMVIWKYLFSSNFYYLNLSKLMFKKLIRGGEVMIQK